MSTSLHCTSWAAGLVVLTVAHLAGQLAAAAAVPASAMAGVAAVAAVAAARLVLMAAAAGIYLMRRPAPHLQPRRSGLGRWQPGCASWQEMAGRHSSSSGSRHSRQVRRPPRDSSRRQLGRPRSGYGRGWPSTWKMYKPASRWECGKYRSGSCEPCGLHEHGCRGHESSGQPAVRLVTLALGISCLEQWPAQLAQSNSWAYLPPLTHVACESP